MIILSLGSQGFSIHGRRNRLRMAKNIIFLDGILKVYELPLVYGQTIHYVPNDIIGGF